MLGLASCLGRKPQKVVLENESTKSRNIEQTVDQLCNQTPDQSGSTVSKQPQMQASSSLNAEQQNPDARTKMIEGILKHLQTKDVGKVVLYGQSGVGKTWIAKEVTKQAISKNLFYVTIWVYKMQIQYSSVFHQISVQQNLVGADCDYHLDSEAAERNSLIQSLQRELEGRKCLVVFDDVDGDANNLMHELETILSQADKSSKIFITTLNNNEMMMGCSSTNLRAKAEEIKPLTLTESKDLLKRSWKADLIQFLEDDDVQDIAMRCKCLPSAIVFTGYSG